MKKIENLKWESRWVSHMGCIKGCLNHLGQPISDGWLYGGSGHAFVLNIVPDLCPSGPTDWDTEMILKLSKNVGCDFNTVYGWKGKDKLDDLQEHAWDFVKNEIDHNIPCYGWELDIPEYYVIFGYDDLGYYISGPGCNNGKGPVSWRNLGTSEIGVVEVRSVRLFQPVNDVKTVKDALSYALEYGYHPESWTDPRSSGGLKGYDTWIKSLENGTASEFGLAYNSAVWTECRKNGVEFLKEANDRLNNPSLDKLFKKSIECYQNGCEQLKLLTELYPFSQDLKMAHIPKDSRIERAVAALKIAREAETKGLRYIFDIL